MSGVLISDPRRQGRQGKPKEKLPHHGEIVGAGGGRGKPRRPALTSSNFSCPQSQGVPYPPIQWSQVQQWERGGKDKEGKMTQCWMEASLLCMAIWPWHNYRRNRVQAARPRAVVQNVYSVGMVGNVEGLCCCSTIFSAAFILALGRKPVHLQKGGGWEGGGVSGLTPPTGAKPCPGYSLWALPSCLAISLSHNHHL